MSRSRGPFTEATSRQGPRMEFVCLGYIEESAWNSLSPAQQDRLVAECFAYDDELRRGGSLKDCAALQPPEQAVTLRRRASRVIVTDGPFSETKEQLGGFFVLKARDLNHAIQLMSQHPGVRLGPFEIRAINHQFNAESWPHLTAEER